MWFFSDLLTFFFQFNITWWFLFYSKKVKELKEGRRGRSWGEGKTESQKDKAIFSSYTDSRPERRDPNINAWPWIPFVFAIYFLLLLGIAVSYETVSPTIYYEEKGVIDSEYTILLKEERMWEGASWVRAV